MIANLVRTVLEDSQGVNDEFNSIQDAGDGRTNDTYKNLADEATFDVIAVRAYSVRRLSETLGPSLRVRSEILAAAIELECEAANMTTHFRSSGRIQERRLAASNLQFYGEQILDLIAGSPGTSSTSAPLNPESCSELR